MNIFFIGLYNCRVRSDFGKFMQIYWYRNNVKNKEIYGFNLLIVRFCMENFLVERNIWGLNNKSEFVFKIKQLFLLFFRCRVEK